MENYTAKLPLQKKLPGELIFYVALFVFLWGYLWLRALYTQLTHDETATFFRYIQPELFMPYALDVSANNHILNSILSYFFYSFLGVSPLVLRLANLLAFSLYFFYVVKFAGLLRPVWLRITGVVVLTCLHNFLEFFALSRGYGLSMGLLLPALWYLTRALEHAKATDYLRTLLLLALAVAANLTLLNTSLIIIGMLALRLVTLPKPSLLRTWRQWLLIIFIGIGPVVYFAAFLFTLKDLGELYYGLTTGIWQVTVRTILYTMLDPDWRLFEIILAFYLIFILVAGIWLIWKQTSWQRIFDKRLLFFYLLTGNLVAVLLLRLLFEVNYPEDRTGLYFVLYFLASLLFLIDELIERIPRRIVWLLLVPLAYIPVHFVFTMNLSHNSFENHKIPKRFYDKIYESYTPGEAPPTVGGYKARELRWAFLNFQHGGRLGKLHGSLFPDTLCDFQIVDTVYKLNKYGLYDTVDYWPQSHFYLLKRKVSLPRRVIFQRDSIATNGVISDLYFNLITLEVDSLAGKTLELIFDLQIDSPATPFKSWIVSSIDNAAGKNVRYEYYALDWMRPRYAGADGHLISSMIVPVPDDAHKMVFYLWNTLEVPFSISNGEAKMLKYQ
ncbi:MAG: hypothetical protein RBR47_10200 [Bacteroidales bacterium]|jgi:hypothetical protein|nr:hypothetical protein [Bacteroidales bacterium]NCU34413.1 hypothetical protein [Candidatus Falkowbacteria bacterium]MDD2631474.1 hypothetical protein [Bacteroidales bacterium]MDD3131836.1 hypothetical protein [Bacteroidales bacterium]MDD4175595.1 hypothetical protein [Bacteroidales bacterium]